MKKCIKCNVEKGEFDFYKHPGMSDGRLNKCKDCCKAEERDRPKKTMAEQEEEGPWESSLVECDLCTYRWVSVRPLGTPKLECPNCGNITSFENIETE